MRSKSLSRATIGASAGVSAIAYGINYAVVWLASTVISAAGGGMTSLLASLMRTDPSATTVSAAAAHGSPVRWWLPGLQVGGELWPHELVLTGSPLVLLALGPGLAALVIGALVARLATSSSPRDQRSLLATSAFFYAVLNALFAWIGAQFSAEQSATVLHTPVWLVFLLALGWALGVGLLGITLYGRARRGRESLVRRSAAVLAALGTVLALGLTGSLPPDESAQTAVVQGPKLEPAPIGYRRPGVAAAIDEVRASSGELFVASQDPWRGVPSLVAMSSPLGTDVTSWLQGHSGLFAVDDVSAHLKLLRSDWDRRGAHHWYEQVIDGVPVYAARVGVHVDSERRFVQALSSGFQPALEVASTEPTLNKDAAVAVALRARPGGQVTELPQLYLLPESPRPDQSTIATLVWRLVVVDPAGGHDSGWAYFVDARSVGEIVKALPVKVAARHREVRDFANQPVPNPDDRPAPARAEGDPATGIAEVDRAYDYAGEYYDFLLNQFQRDSFDGNGAPLDIEVRYVQRENVPYQNAYFYNDIITFGDGMVTRDILGHEFAHGIVQHTAGLEYVNQSGALNESFADMVGEAFESAHGGNDWLLGGDSTLGAFRSMKDPRAFGNPAHTKDYEVVCFDNGGVHLNSGIPNQAFYILAQRIGTLPAVRIAYRALTRYLHETSGFNDARAAFLQAAWDLHGKDSQHGTEVRRAWGAVGVDGTFEVPRADCDGWCFAVASLRGEGLAGLDPSGFDVAEISAALLRTRDLLSSGDTPALAHYQMIYTRANEDALRLLTGSVALQRQTAHAMQSLAPLLEAVGTSRGAQVMASQALIDELNALMDAYIVAGRANGADGLANLLASERSRVDMSGLVGMSADQIKVYLDQLLSDSGVPGAPAAGATVDTSVKRELSESGNADVIVMLRDEASLDRSPSLGASRAERTAHVYRELGLTARRSQQKLRELLTTRGARFEQFWIVNAIAVYAADADLIALLARQGEVVRVRAAGTAMLHQATPSKTSVADTNGIEWGVMRVRAPDVWATGVRGEGVVVANIDTGVQFDHPALARSYRGWRAGGAYEHNYNWFDPTGVCGATAPCDNNNHGTHVMGTMVGDDGTNHVGVAPGANWVAVKGCGSSICEDVDLLRAGQWVIAPTDLNGQNPRPDLAPHIVNNSWGGAPGDPFYADIVNAWVQAGIMPVFANGNSGPGCGSANSPGDYPNAYSAGAFADSGAIASFSSRGESAFGRATKPNVAAPGVAVRSSIPGGLYTTYDGTSMAAPHLSGTLALLWSAAPSLIGDVNATRQIIDDTAEDVYDGSCGGTADVNNVWGEGRIDALSAVTFAPTSPLFSLAGTVTDRHGAAVAGAIVTAELPSGVRRTETTDAAGAYTLRLPAGTYQLAAEAFGFRRSQAPVTIVEGQASRHDVQLATNPRYRVVGNVHLNNQPIPGATISFDGVPIPPVTTGREGEFGFLAVPSGTYTLRMAGKHCASETTMQVVVDWDEAVTVAAQPKAEAFGYRCAATTAAYPQATNPLALSGDDEFAQVELPFTFRFYGRQYTTAYVSTNGYIAFERGNAMSLNSVLPSTASPNAAVFPFWDDLVVDEQSSVETSTTGSAPQRAFVVEWNNVAIRDDVSQRITFAAVLQENGHVTFHYAAIADGDLARGASATVGIESHRGAMGAGFSRHEPILRSGLSLRFKGPTILEGLVTDYYGNPVPNAFIAVGRDSNFDGDGVSSDYRGRYRLQVSPGENQLSLRHAVFADRHLSVTVGADEIRRFDIAMYSKRNTISGRVVDQAGNPVAGATLAGFSSDSSQPAITDGNGYYRIEGVAPGNTSIQPTSHCFLIAYFTTAVVTHDMTIDVVAQRALDSFGHGCVDVATQDFVTDTRLALSGDDETATVALPFPVTYYGTTQATAYVSTNGLIGFTGPHAAAPTDNDIQGPARARSGGAPVGPIYAYWDDLVIDEQASVWTGVTGGAPTRGFIVEWRNALIAGTELRVTVQAVIYEDDRIRFQFPQLPEVERAVGTYTGVGIESPHSGDALDGANLVWRMWLSLIIFIDNNPYLQRGLYAGLAVEFRSP